jgi:multiple sugar transport system substrate-binding protein
MKKSKWIAVALVGVSAVVAAVGSQVGRVPNAEASTGGIDKSLTADITVMLPAGDYIKFFQNVVLPGFHKQYPNVKVTLATDSQLDTQVAAGNPPDIHIGVWGYEPAKYAKMGKLVNISTLPGAADIVKRIDPKFVVKNFGGLYYLPWNATTTMMIYNKQLFKEAGLNPNKPPVTFAEYLADAKKISSLPPRSNGDKVYGNIFWNDALTWGGWYWSMLAPIYYNMNDGKYKLFNSFGTDIVFDKPQAKMADFFQFCRQAQQYAPPTMKKDFFNRNVGMWLQFGYGWENNLLQAKDTPMVIGKDVGVAPIPVPKAGMKSWSTLDGRSIEIFRTTPTRQEASWALAQYLMSYSINLRACEVLHQLPVLLSEEHNSFFQRPDTKPFVEQAQHAIINEPYAAADAVEQAVLKAYMQAVVKQQITPQQAVKQAASDARAAMNQQ